MSRISIHQSPVEADLLRNRSREPEGERIRAELIEFLTRNKISSIYLDTPLHTVEIRSAKLPPKIKAVLTRWGSIYVVDDSPDVPDDWTQPERPANWDDNIIPPITHPLGRGWDQPALTEIAIDDTCARMSRAIFEDLCEYSATNPSGVYEGKMWRRHNGSFDRAFIAGGGKPNWQLCWYGYSKIGPGSVSNNRREIVLTDGELPE